MDGVAHDGADWAADSHDLETADLIGLVWVTALLIIFFMNRSGITKVERKV